MGLVRKAKINESFCVSCGTCMRECPLEAISVWRGVAAAVDERKCIGCGKCVRVCPVGCIGLEARS